MTHHSTFYRQTPAKAQLNFLHSPPTIVSLNCPSAFVLVVVFAMALEDLPSELLNQIMQSIDCPFNLQAITQASPKCAAIYLSSLRFILTPVLQRAIHPEAMQAALAAVSVPPNLATPQKGNKVEISRFLNWHSGEEDSQFPTSKEALLQLRHIYMQAAQFIEDYASGDLHFRETGWVPLHLSPACPGIELGRRTSESRPASSRLSGKELVRLQRAFFRYEVWRRTCHGPVLARTDEIASSRTPTKYDYTKLRRFVGEDLWRTGYRCCA